MTENDTKFRNEQKTKILEQGQVVSPHVIYFKQTIYNACGMMALIHALANNRYLLNDGKLSIVTYHQPTSIIYYYCC